MKGVGLTEQEIVKAVIDGLGVIVSWPVVILILVFMFRKRVNDGLNLMPYLNDLEWMSDLGDFSDAERRVLLALSHHKYKWRSRERIRQLTRIRSGRLDRVLSGLLEDDLIQHAFSADRKIVYGLKERVG